MANATLEKEEPKILDVEEGYEASQNDPNEDILNSLQSFMLAEANLTEQKEHLTALLNQLETKVEEELKKRKRKVQRLNSEVSELKRNCERFARWINSESTLECSQTGV